MRVCGVFSALEDVLRAKKRVQADRLARERVRAALLPIDDADGRAALQPGLPERVDRIRGRASRGDDVLDEADLLAGREASLQPVLGTVALGLLADEQEWEAGRERGCRGERDGPELGPGDARGRGRDLTDPGGDPLPQGGEDLGARLEAVLVEVVA